MWEFWIDRGGTFTDIISISPEKEIVTDKYLSENLSKYRDAGVFAIKKRLGLSTREQVQPSLIKQIRLGTTVATNALLERKGEKTLLITNKGFKDLLKIGSQKRPDLFALNIVTPEPIYQSVIEADFRIDYNGNILSSPDIERLKKEISDEYKKGYRSAAVVFMHSYRFNGFENRVFDLLKEAGFDYIYLSHRSAPVMKITARGDTACVDAYLTPVLKRYTDQFIDELSGQHPAYKDQLLDKIFFMHSGGGLVKGEDFCGKESILSGPAGGIAGAVKACQLDSETDIISFDMGGTSTDVSHYRGEFERNYENEVAGVKIVYPMLDIHTVASGGGSIVGFDKEKFFAGPVSAGSDPGPACYRKNGPLTITDCNLFLGRIRAAYFPKVFGKDSNQGPDIEAVKRKLAEIKADVFEKTQISMPEEEIAAGCLKIASEKMAAAIKKISLQKGRNPEHYVLCTFGGAGGQHACEIADILSIRKILIHPFSGVLSAYGLGVSDRTKGIEKTIDRSLDTQNLTACETVFESIFKDLSSRFKTHDRIIKKLHLKYQGSDIAVIVDFTKDLKQAVSFFEKKHEDFFGFKRENSKILISSVSMEIIESSKILETRPMFSDKTPACEKTADIFFDDQYVRSKIYKRKHLIPGFEVKGPALIIEKTGTNLVWTGWTAHIRPSGNLFLLKDEKKAVKIKKVIKIQDEEKDEETKKIKNIPDISKPDPVYLEIFNSLFSFIAEEMGIILEKTAFSVNIKERKDFSCAVFDKNGTLCANAPHIPVHLGSMEDCVKFLIKSQNTRINPGDVYLTNNPATGGTHLPDLTVITPVFRSMLDNGRQDHHPLFFLASRGHHSDIGGISPGSMPSSSTTLEEEGVVIDFLKICINGKFRKQAVEQVLLGSPYPCRNPGANIEDIKSKVAANNRGISGLKKAVEEYSLEMVEKYMAFVRENAKKAVEDKIRDIKEGQFQITQDNGSILKVSLTKESEKRLVIDFSGTSTASRDNYNAPESVTKAAVLYVLRTLVNKDIPLNSGCLEPVKLIIPKNSILSPPKNYAVCAGNVELSQNVCDLVFGALNVLASSQGTMNNITFGNKNYQYYETICGGAPAGRGFNGCDAVHTHMTNSLITDPEVMEQRFPVILKEFSIRSQSGGKGRFCGGNGVKRVIEFKEDMEVSFLTGKRLTCPHGIMGGQSGKSGKNTVVYSDGRTYRAGFAERVTVSKGDAIIIETPGGGGFGSK